MTQRIIFQISQGYTISLGTSSLPINTSGMLMSPVGSFVLERTIKDEDGDDVIKRRTLFTLNSGEEIDVEKITELLSIVIVEQNQATE